MLLHGSVVEHIHGRHATPYSPFSLILKKKNGSKKYIQLVLDVDSISRRTISQTMSIFPDRVSIFFFFLIEAKPSSVSILLRLEFCGKFTAARADAESSYGRGGRYFSRFVE